MGRGGAPTVPSGRHLVKHPNSFRNVFNKNSFDKED